MQILYFDVWRSLIYKETDTTDHKAPVMAATNVHSNVTTQVSIFKKISQKWKVHG